MLCARYTFFYKPTFEAGPDLWFRNAATALSIEHARAHFSSAFRALYGPLPGELLPRYDTTPRTLFVGSAK